MLTHKKYSRLKQGAISESGAHIVEALLAVAIIALIAIPSMQSVGHANNKLQCENLIRFHGQGDPQVETLLSTGRSGYVQAPGGAGVWACCTRINGCFYAGHNVYRLFPEVLN